MSTVTLYAQILYDDLKETKTPDLTFRQVDSRDVNALKRLVMDLYPNGIYRFYIDKEV